MLRNSSGSFSFTAVKGKLSNECCYHIQLRRVARFGYGLHNLKIVKSIHRRVLLLLKLQAEICYFTKRNTPS